MSSLLQHHFLSHHPNQDHEVHPPKNHSCEFIHALQLQAHAGQHYNVLKARNFLYAGLMGHYTM